MRMTSPSSGSGQQKSVSVEGYVLDSACAFTKNLEKPVSRECALMCAKAGSQLVILTDDGSIYWPIADTTPATGQNARLLEFAGGRVTAKGKLYDRGASHALVIAGLLLPACTASPITTTFWPLRARALNLSPVAARAR